MQALFLLVLGVRHTVVELIFDAKIQQKNEIYKFLERKWCKCYIYKPPMTL